MGAVMSLAENKQRGLQMVAAWNRGDVDGVAAHWAPDVVHYDEDGHPVDTEELIKIMKSSLVSFPDLRMTVQSIIAEGDRVMLRIDVTATHQGEFIGVPPTGRKVTWHTLEELRFNEAGKVIEHWDVMNFSPLFRELGVVPPPGL